MTRGVAGTSGGMPKPTSTAAPMTFRASQNGRSDTPAFLRSGEPNQGGELNWVMPIIGTIAGKVDNMAQVQGLGSRFDVPWALLLR